MQFLLLPRPIVERSALALSSPALQCVQEERDHLLLSPQRLHQRVGENGLRALHRAGSKARCRALTRGLSSNQRAQRTMIRCLSGCCFPAFPRPAQQTFCMANAIFRARMYCTGRGPHNTNNTSNHRLNGNRKKRSAPPMTDVC